MHECYITWGVATRPDFRSGRAMTWLPSTGRSTSTPRQTVRPAAPMTPSSKQASRSSQLGLPSPRPGRGHAANRCAERSTRSRAPRRWCPGCRARRRRRAAARSCPSRGSRCCRNNTSEHTRRPMRPVVHQQSDHQHRGARASGRLQAVHTRDERDGGCELPATPSRRRSRVHESHARTPGAATSEVATTSARRAILRCCAAPGTGSERASQFGVARRQYGGDGADRSARAAR